MEVDVAVPYPTSRVWRAVSDPTIVRRWFLPGDFVARPGARFTFQPSARFGLETPIEVEVLDVVAPTRLAMVWRAPTMHARVVWRLADTPTGTRVRVTIAGYIADRGGISRDRFQAALEDRLARGLPEVLAEMEATARAWRRTVNQRFIGDLRRRLTRATASAPVPEPLVSADTMELSRFAPRRRPSPRLLAVLAGAAVLLAGAVLAVIQLTGRPALAPRIDESLTPATTLLSPSPPTPRPAAALTVAYATTDTWSGGYTGQLTISAASPLSGWIASLTLPTRAAVTNSWEADYEQRGVAVSLTPKEWNATLPAGTRIQVGFQVDLAPDAPRYPLTCAVNGVACSGS